MMMSSVTTDLRSRAGHIFNMIRYFEWLWRKTYDIRRAHIRDYYEAMVAAKIFTFFVPITSMERYQVECWECKNSQRFFTQHVISLYNSLPNDVVMASRIDPLKIFCIGWDGKGVSCWQCKDHCSMGILKHLDIYYKGSWRVLEAHKMFCKSPLCCSGLQSAVEVHFQIQKLCAPDFQLQIGSGLVEQAASLQDPS